MKTRKVNPEGTYLHQKELLDKVHLIHDGEPWTQALTDLLLEGWLVHNWRYKSARGNGECFLKNMGRTWNSLYSRLWKTVTRYREASTYLPGSRTDRTDRPFTDRDLGLMELAVGPKGIPNGAHLPDHIARILGRNPNEVSSWITKLLNSSEKERIVPSLHIFKKRIPVTPEEIAKVVYTRLKGSIDKVLKNI